MAIITADNLFIIENQYFKKEFQIKSDRIVSSVILNKLSGSCIRCGEECEEFYVRFKKGFFYKSIYSSQLEIDRVSREDKACERELVFTFKSINVKGCEIVFRLYYDFSEQDAFYKKHIEIILPESDGKGLILDSVEFADISVAPGFKAWSLPEQKRSHVSGFALSLGQPVYVDSFYFGCEFPASLNTIENNKVSIRTFSGKPLSEITAGGSYKSNKFVCGVSESNNFTTVQKAFYSYIDTISKPSKFRIQYNSWFDNMLNITQENVTSSFLEVEKGLTKYGVKPVDSYVADDGWNDYSKGFWTFNSKFPHRLTPFANLAESLGSRFGVWVGPRGGYTTDTIKFARQIEKAGNGYVNKQAHDICVASDKYSKKTGEMMLEFIDSFHLNYFKLDGFAQFPCKNKKHDHMVGGYKDMYFYTDLWKKWIDIFQKMNEKGESDFWINLTCYAPPSPWFLQWVNSIWMQISDDVNFIGKSGQVSDKDRMLSYRDERYFDFYKSRQFQLPQRVLYNHDPIYGNEAKVKMTDDEFRDYLFTMATRGTAFWELYYSHNIMNEAKWRINKSVLSFLEDNIEVLSQSVIFGDRPSASGVYGYSCFNDNEGIVSLRNSSDKQTEYMFCLSEENGVRSSFSKSPVTVILPYTTSQSSEKYGYGDSIKVLLKPYETKIFHFNRPCRLPEVTYVKAISRNELEVSFNQLVDIKNINCHENPVCSCKLLEDYMSVVIAFENEFSAYNKLELHGISDISGNVCDAEVEFDYYVNNIVTGTLFGKTDFAVKAVIEDENESVLLKQGDEILLEVNAEGKISFRVGNVTLTSHCKAKVGMKITALRERNGTLKIYSDGILDSGMKTDSFILSRNNNVYCVNNVIVLNKALSFDEI